MSVIKKRLYLSILGAGLCVVLYDVFSGEDLPAQAVASGSEQANPAAGTEADGDGVILSVAPFPRTLPEATLLVESRDLFVPSRSVMGELLGPKEDPATEDGELDAVPLTPPVPFDEEHTLSAIMEIGGSRVAVVDGKMLREGQRLSDCVVVAIGDRDVRFVCSELEEELRLDRPVLGEIPQD